MYFNHLINSLIGISGLSKTDFAMEMHYSPSAISKILSGKQLPSKKNFNHFIEEAAYTFGQLIYPQKIQRIHDLFLVTYNFHNERELMGFLKKALEISYLGTLGKERFDEQYFYNTKSAWEELDILNHLSVSLSYILAIEGKDVEIYSTVKFTRFHEGNLIKRLQYNGKPGDPKLILYQIFSRDVVEKTELLKIFEIYALLMKQFDVRICYQETLPDYELMYINKHMLVIFTFIFEMMPKVKFVDNLVFVMYMKGQILEHFKEIVVFRGQELEDFIKINSYEKQDQWIERVRYVFAFIPMEVVSPGKTLPQGNLRDDVPDKIGRFFQGLLQKETTFFISDHASFRFFETGILNFPVIKKYPISEGKIYALLSRNAKYIFDDQLEFRVIKSPIENLYSYVADDYLCIYTPGNALNQEKLLMFPVNATLSPGVEAEKKKSYVVDKNAWAELVRASMHKEEKQKEEK